MKVSIVRPAALPDSRFDICIVIDVLRATSTASVLCERVDELCIVRTPAELGQLPPREAGYALFSELSDIVSELPRFDNSPVQARTVALDGRTPVLVTTNGTLAVALAAAMADEVLLASFTNLTATVELVRARGVSTVAIMPAGHVKHAEQRAEDDGCAKVVAALLEGAAIEIPAVVAVCRVDPRVERRAQEPAIAADIDVCFSVDSVPVVPRVTSAAGGWFGVARAR